MILLQKHISLTVADAGLLIIFEIIVHLEKKDTFHHYKVNISFFGKQYKIRKLL